MPALGSRGSILLFDDAGVMQFVAAAGGCRRNTRPASTGISPWRPDDTEAEPLFVLRHRHDGGVGRAKAVIRNEDIRALAFIPLFGNGHGIGKSTTTMPNCTTFPSARNGSSLWSLPGNSPSASSATGAEEARRIAVDSLREFEERFRQLSEMRR